MKELENKIRKALPRLQEVTKGCLAYDKLGKRNYTIIDNHYCPQLYSYDYSSFRTLDFEELKNFDFVGHRIQLNDVLEWLLLNKNHSCNMQNDNFYIFGISWNLSSVFLADQSKELINFLNTL